MRIIRVELRIIDFSTIFIAMIKPVLLEFSIIAFVVKFALVEIAM